MQHRPPRPSTYPRRVSHVPLAPRPAPNQPGHADAIPSSIGNQQPAVGRWEGRTLSTAHAHAISLVTAQRNGALSNPIPSIKPRPPAYRCYLKPQFPVPLSRAPFRQQMELSSMVSREQQQHYPHDLEHLMLDPAALGGGVSSCLADPEIQPQLLAALGEYLSADASDAEAEADDEFMMYEFKVRRCARARSHDWTVCPYAHPGEAARRRDPRRVAYTGEPCPDFRRRPGAACPRGNACPFAHGTFELWLHPSRYRTRPCRAGVSCRRRVCFFAHTAAELRACAPHKDDSHSPLSLSPKSTLLASLWESPPVSPVQGRRTWIDAVDEIEVDAAEMEDLMLAMRELSFRKAAAASSAPVVAPPVLPLVTEEDGPDLGWVSELVM